MPAMEGEANRVRSRWAEIKGQGVAGLEKYEVAHFDVLEARAVGL